jgi:hypothetical protein
MDFAEVCSVIKPVAATPAAEYSVSGDTGATDPIQIFTLHKQIKGHRLLVIYFT